VFSLNVDLITFQPKPNLKEERLLFNIIAGFLISIHSFSNMVLQKCTNYKKPQQ